MEQIQTKTITENQAETVRILNEEIWCTIAPSPIHGIGVFAIRDIPEGTYFSKCSTLPSMIYPHHGEEHGLHPAIQKIAWQRMDGGSIYNHTHPNKQTDLRALMNHSNNSNSNGMKTLRDIKCGEEVTEDYERDLGLQYNNPEYIFIKNLHQKD
ncbi:MAG: hypothetical protein Q7R56_01725 [Nanoarchaeota archaeon]|nr:hypothetical protein [Nanoarchaeota archaeon]